MNKAIFWTIILFCFGYFIYLVSDTLTPFVVSFIFAYLLQPAIDNNAKRLNIPRAWITSTIFTWFIGLIILGATILLPIIYNQIWSFIHKIPKYKKHLEIGVENLTSKFDNIDPEITNKITDAVQNVLNNILSVVALAANNLWGYTLATINFFTIIFLVPIILYYFLRDWPQIIEEFEKLLPIRGKSKIRVIFTEINELLSAYIRGQLNICLILSIYYALGLTFIGVELALLLGIITGFMIIIPFIGVLIPFCLAMLSCYFSYGLTEPLLYVIILFTVGYLIESYILTPKIIGGRIGLHPVWIIFAVFAIGSLFGFVGIIFAIPIAGIIKLLTIHLIDFYRSSKFYKE